MVFICVGQGNIQRWNLRNEDGMIVMQYTFTKGDQLEPVHPHSPFSFIFWLVSSDYNHFESTVSVIATVSLHNHVLECADGSLSDAVTIHIAGFSEIYTACMIIKHDCSCLIINIYYCVCQHYSYDIITRAMITPELTVTDI